MVQFFQAFARLDANIYDIETGRGIGDIKLQTVCVIQQGVDAVITWLTTLLRDEYPSILTAITTLSGDSKQTVTNTFKPSINLIMQTPNSVDTGCV